MKGGPRKNGLYVKMNCPACGWRISQPLHRGSVVFESHPNQDSSGRCRMWIGVDPTGEDHIVRRLAEPGECAEDALEEVIERHYPRTKEAVFLESLACVRRERAS